MMFVGKKFSIFKNPCCSSTGLFPSPNVPFWLSQIEKKKVHIEIIFIFQSFI